MKSVLLCLAICVAYSTAGEIAPYCVDGNGSDVRFSLYSNRNASGFWNAKFKLEHDDSALDDGHREVHMEQRTENCNGKNTIVITGTIGIPSGGETLLARQAPSGYIQFPGLKNYYKFYEEPHTWPVAYSICEDEGAHLAIVNSPLEAKVLATLATDDRVFVGFDDIETEGNYVTIFGQPLKDAGYNITEKNGGTNENCGTIKKNAELADHWCYTKEPFICEKESA